MFKVNNVNTKAPLMSFAVIVNFEYISNPFVFLLLTLNK